MLPRAIVVFVCFLFASGVPVATFGVPIVLPGSPAPSTPETPLETKLRAGHEALNKNELSKAATAFGEAHKLDPKSLSPLFGLAEVARLKKDGKGAESWLRKALSIAPDSAQVHQAWGRYHWSARNLPQAEAAFKRAISLDPRLVAAHVDLGGIYMEVPRKPGEAAQAYRKALTLQPDVADARYGLGLALALQGQAVEAAAELEQAAKLMPGNPLPLQALGRLHVNQGKLNNAVDAFTRALQARSDFLPARIDRGDVYSVQGNMEKAIADYSEVVKTQPKNAHAQYKLGFAYHGGNKPAEAEQAYRAAIAADPKYAPAYNNLAWLLVQRRQKLDDALRFAKKAVALAPEAAQFQDTLGTVYLARGEPDQAITPLQKAAASKPPQAEFYFRLGVAHDKKGNRKEAVDAYKKALAIDGNFPQSENARKRLEHLSGS